MKRIGILLCSVALLLGALVFPTAAQEITVTDEVTFIQALYDGGNIVLQNDIYLTSFVIVRSDVTIDLNGHQILVAEGDTQAFLDKLTDMTAGTVESMEIGQEYRAFPVE